MKVIRARLALLSLWCVTAVVAAGLYPALARGYTLLHSRFEQPYWLAALALVPVLLWRTTYGSDRRSVKLRFSDIEAFAGAPRGFRASLLDLPGALRSVGFLFCVVALARPVSALRETTAEEQGIDLVLTLDLSGSMQAVIDNFPPDLERYLESRERGIPPTRLDGAKAVLRDFIARRTSDRIGAVVFGKAAYVVSPPTLDYQLLDYLVSRMELQLIDGNGTAIGDALGVAVARLRRSEAKSKAIVLLTDGDNKGGQLSPEYAAHLANKEHTKIYAIQVGESGKAARVFRDFNLFGQPTFAEVEYPTNPELLGKLAELTGGRMYVAADVDGLRKSLHDVLDQLEKTAFEASAKSYESLFRYFLLPGVLLFAFEVLLSATLLRRFP